MSRQADDAAVLDGLKDRHNERGAHEPLDATPVTTDHRLGRVSGLRCRVEAI